MAFNIQTVERFLRYEFPGAATGTVVAKGLLFELAVDPRLPQRRIWIACGAFWQDNALNQWVVQGKLNFYFQGQKSGELWFGDASQNADNTTRAAAARSVLRLEPSGLGSQGPVLTYQEQSAVAAGRNDLDIHCFNVPVDADAIQYEIEHSFYDVDATFTLRFLLGMRVISTA